MILYAGSYSEMVVADFGGYGEGIYCFYFDANKGSLQLKHVQPARNPSYLCISSAKYLYTHTEIIEAKKPRVQVYEINKIDYSLQLINEQEIPGGCPCHINFSEKNNCILVACYESGNTMLYPVAANGRLLPLAKIILHKGSSVNKIRQEKAHAHAALVDEAFNNILITDLGMDKVMVYRLDVKNEAIDADFKQSLLLPPGSGPRHIAIHPVTGDAFVLNELTGTVTRMPYTNGHIENGKTYTILPKAFDGTPSAAAIRVSADGKFIYASERSDNSIAVLKFDHENETLEIIQRRDTMGKTPRDFILDPTGNWLLVANQDADSIAIFRVDKNTGKIEPGHIVDNIKSPTCLAWLPIS